MISIIYQNLKSKRHNYHIIIKNLFPSKQRTVNIRCELKKEYQCRFVYVRNSAETICTSNVLLPSLMDHVLLIDKMRYIWSYLCFYLRTCNKLVFLKTLTKLYIGFWTFWMNVEFVNVFVCFKYIYFNLWWYLWNTHNSHIIK